MNQNMSVLEKLTTEIFPKLAAEGKFGRNILRFVKFKPDEKFQAVDHFASSIYFGDVILATKNRKYVSQSVVIKAQTGGKLNEIADKLSYNLQLYNEVLFYTEILPLLKRCDPDDTVTKLFPKCFYAHAVKDDPSSGILVFENLQKQGFRLSPWKTFNDFKHIELTLTWLGKFHALSLVCKKNYPEKFRSVINKILEPHWTEKRLKNPDDFFKENCKRGILPLRDDPNYNHKVDDLLALVENVDPAVAKMISPIEPSAVITHGDFNRNNIFYKYDSNNEPCEVKFIDWVTIRYASPVIDLTYYLFINSSPAVQAEHWVDILKTYHSAVTSNPYLDPEFQLCFIELQIDIRRRGFFGYVWASWYLPMMMSLESEANDDWFKLTVDELIKCRLAAGGEKATMLVTQLVRHMIDLNFDFKYVFESEVNKIEPLKIMRALNLV